MVVAFGDASTFKYDCSCFLPDHDNGSVSVSVRNERHDGSVSYAEPFDPVNPIDKVGVRNFSS